MTFNRYIAIRAVVETIGALSCMLMVVIGHSLIGVIVTAVVALVWAGGEIWVVTVLNKRSPRRDELSDQHQGVAMQFALFVLIGALVILGFVYTIWNMVTTSGFLHIINPMMLPALAMCALAVSDVRYLWLEHDGSNGDDDED